MNANAEMFSRPNDQAKIHDFESIQPLWAPVPNRKGHRANLKFGERNGSMRISVFTNQEEGPKVLWAGYDPVTFEQFLTDLQAVAVGPRGTKRSIENQAKEKEEDSPVSEEAGGSKYFTRNILHFGKDEEGIVWIGIEQKDSAFTRFKFENSMWHHFRKEDGSRVTREEGSVRQAVALARLLTRITGTYAGRLRPPYEKGKTAQRPKASAPSSEPSMTGSGFGSDGDYDIPY